MNGVIAAGHPCSAEAGAAMFAAGGNAVDAAVAAGFAAFVSETLVVNIGASGYATFAAADGQAKVYDFSSTMPSLRPQKEMDFREVVIGFGNQSQSFWIGRASSAVPGAVAGLCRLAEQQGSLPLKTLMAPAIKLAEGGLVLNAAMAGLLRLLTKINSDTAEVAALFIPGGRHLEEGESYALPKLAKTLSRLAAEGPDLFYKGDLAKAIVRDHQQHGGLITAEDMASYQVPCLSPISVAYRGLEILLPPPSSLGGPLIAFALSLLNNIPLQQLKHHSKDHIHILAHVMRLSNIARGEWAGLPQAQRLSHFLSQQRIADYATQLQQALDQDSHQNDPPAPPLPGNTSHISAMDQVGNCVSITLSAGEAAGYLVGDTGMILNNMLGEHDLNPDGFHLYRQGERMISMMSPAIVRQQGRPIMALGSAGSNRLRSAILQTLSNVVDFKMEPDQAVNQSRIHFEEGLLHLEGGVPHQPQSWLEKQGFSVRPWQEQSVFFGGAQLVQDCQGQLKGGADRRRGGAVRLA